MPNQETHEAKVAKSVEQLESLHRLIALAPPDPHSPEPIFVTRVLNNSEKEEAAAYPVMGTNRVLVVCPDPDGPGWIGLHAPTGLAVNNKFASREEAEDILSWLWLNSDDQDGLGSNDPESAVEAMGNRVRSRFKGGRPIKGARNRRKLRLKRRDPRMTKAEAAVMHRAGALRAIYWWRFHQLHERYLDLVANLREMRRTCESQQAVARHAAADVAMRTEALEQQTCEYTELRETLDAQRAEFESEHAVFRTARNEILQIRRQLLDAIFAIDVEAERAGVTRRLRKVRVRSNEPDPGDPEF